MVALALVVLRLLALSVWFLVASAGIILKLVGSVVIVIIASAAWQQIRGKP